MMCNVTFFGNMMLVLASHDADEIITGDMAFIMSRQLKQGAT